MPISTKHHSVKGIQVCLKKDHVLFQLEIIRNSGELSISTKLCARRHWVKRIQDSSFTNKGPFRFQKGDSFGQC